MISLGLNRKTVFMLLWIIKTLTWLTLLFLKDLLKSRVMLPLQKLNWLQNSTVRRLGILMGIFILFAFCPLVIRRPFSSLARIGRV